MPHIPHDTSLFTKERNVGGEKERALDLDAFVQLLSGTFQSQTSLARTVGCYI